MKHGSTRKPEGNRPGESVLTSRRCLIVRELGEPLEMRKQETALSAGALIDDAKKWKSIDWKQARRQVRRLQVRIAKAVTENRWIKLNRYNICYLARSTPSYWL